MLIIHHFLIKRFDGVAVVEINTKLSLPIYLCPPPASVECVGRQIKAITYSFLNIQILKFKKCKAWIIIIDWRNTWSYERLISNVINLVTYLWLNVGSMNVTSEADYYVLIVVLDNVDVLLLNVLIPKYLPWIFIWMLWSVPKIVKTWWNMHHYYILLLLFFWLLSISF